ncbi:AAA family ATPase [Streptomyces sp. NRRL B-24484]|uniref:AAA family ATPase n=1 Tax=Streptomyces sp. NRRL B-24484 TaxID=1463833 RepID=UPI0006949B0C|nr:AAA family ATPase [Streptomyces sp. NRRL B-24484]
MIVLIGPAGSGKSTFASSQPSDHVVELDSLRALVTGGDAGDQGATAEAVKIQDIVVTARLVRANPLVIDSTNAEARVRAHLLQQARLYGRRTRAVVFVTPLEECLRRNAERPASRRVPDDVLRWQHQLVAEALPGLTDEGFDEVHLHTASATAIP